MPRETEQRVLQLVRAILRTHTNLKTPDWLQRPGQRECQRRWPLICSTYHELTGLTLPEEMPPRERRQVDGIIQLKGQAPRIIEVDEYQHFNIHRSATLRRYPRTVLLAFDRRQWIAWGDHVTRLTTSFYGKPRPPLFPEGGGRHRQRAFRDALCDLLPPLYGYAPTLRIAECEVESWIHGRGARQRLSELLAERGVL